MNEPKDMDEQSFQHDEHTAPMRADSDESTGTNQMSFSSLNSHRKKTNFPPYSARNWRPCVKLLISIIAIISYFVVILTTSIYIASIPGLISHFNISLTLSISPITFYAMGFVFGPIFTSALSEEFGRAYIYKGSLLCHLIFTIVGGAAPNFRTIAVARALAGLLGSPCVTVFAGVLNDLWKMPEDKSAALLFGLYGIMGAAASEIGPVAGEAIVNKTGGGWRWSFWLTAILIGVCFLGMVFVPETYEPEIARKRIRAQGQPGPSRNLVRSLKTAAKRPLHMLLVEPIIFPTAAIVTMGQVVVFVFYASYPLILQRAYGFSHYAVGLAFIPLLVGTLLALPVMAGVTRGRHNKTNPQPEETLTGAMIAGVLLPVSLFWMAWTARPSIHWICPLLAGVPYGLGFALSQLVYPLYKNEVYGAELGASAFAVDVAMRYTFSCVFPLFTIQMVDAIGFAWSITICACVLLVLAPVPWILKRQGPKLRARSRYVGGGEAQDDGSQSARERV